MKTRPDWRHVPVGERVSKVMPARSCGGATASPRQPDYTLAHACGRQSRPAVEAMIAGGYEARTNEAAEDCAHRFMARWNGGGHSKQCKRQASDSEAGCKRRRAKGERCISVDAFHMHATPVHRLLTRCRGTISAGRV